MARPTGLERWQAGITPGLSSLAPSIQWGAEKALAARAQVESEQFSMAHQQEAQRFQAERDTVMFRRKLGQMIATAGVKPGRGKDPVTGEDYDDETWAQEQIGKFGLPPGMAATDAPLLKQAAAVSRAKVRVNAELADHQALLAAMKEVETNLDAKPFENPQQREVWAAMLNAMVARSTGKPGQRGLAGFDFSKFQVPSGKVSAVPQVGYYYQIGGQGPRPVTDLTWDSVMRFSQERTKQLERKRDDLAKTGPLSVLAAVDQAAAQRAVEAEQQKVQWQLRAEERFRAGLKPEHIANARAGIGPAPQPEAYPSAAPMTGDPNAPAW